MNPPIKILYIEDDQLDQQALLRLVHQQSLPYDLTIADTLAQARARLAESRFDLILADYHLPDGHSTQLFDEVRDTPFILITGTLDEQLALRTLERGADDYLPKDPKHRHLDALPLTVEKVLHRHRLRGVEERLTRELRRALDYDQAVMANMGEGLYTLDTQGRVTYVNPAAERLFGWSSAELLGREMHEVVHYKHPDGRVFPAEECASLKALQRGQVLTDHEDVFIRKDGTFFPVVHSSSPIKSGSSLIGLVVVFRDVTTHEQAEEALRRSEALSRDRYAELEQIYRYAPVGLATFDRDHRFVRINERMAEINGFPRDYHLGKTIFEIIPELALRLQALWRPVLEQGEPVLDAELQGETPRFPGIRRTWLGNYFPLRSGHGEVVGVIAAVLEVTERKQAEEQLKRRNQHLQLLHQAAADLLLGRPPADLIGALQEQIARNLGTEVFMFYTASPGNSHFRLQACSGVTREQQQKLQTLRYGRAICARPAEALQPIIATHLQTVQAPNRRFVRKLGLQSYLYYPLIVDGHLQGTLAFASRQRADYDRTELDFFQTIARTLAEAMERQRLESELKLHATHLEELVRERTASLREALAELEHMSYSMVHDMRAPLRAMQSFAHLMQQECGDCRRLPGQDYLSRIRESSNRLDRLITDALNYNKVLRQELPITAVDLGRLLRGMIETYPNLQPSAADITIQFDELRVLGNESLLTQCFGNLLDNAVKFVTLGVKPRVRVWAEELSPRSDLAAPQVLPPSRVPSQATAATRHALVPESGEGRTRRVPPSITHRPSTFNYVRLWVEDNGIGIPEYAQERIFQMFQRMHPEREYPGTGIGLTIVRKAVERMKGRVGLKSEPGRGSKFWIELPTASRAQPTESLR